MEKLSKKELIEKLGACRMMFFASENVIKEKDNKIRELIRENTELRNEIAKLQREKKV